MRAYIKLLLEVVDNQLNSGNGFNLLKFESFTTPNIYFKICEHYYSKYKECEINFIAKLSKDKYEIWKEDESFIPYLNKLDNLGYIEKEDSLTKWRNTSFLVNDTNSIVFLMGTEAVEDKGGLEEFYKISPETIERFVGKQYDILLKELGFKYEIEEYEIFNKIIDNIFLYTNKDLLKLSNLLESIDNSLNYYLLIQEICTKLNETWGIPNIMQITEKDFKGDNFKKRILQAYRFSRRVGLEYNSESKIEKLKEKIDKYYQINHSDIESEFNKILPGYNDFKEFKVDLLNYAGGINLELVKEKILNVDFTVISEILGVKQKGKGGTVKPTIIKGDPFKGLFLPIIFEINKQKYEVKEQIASIEININQIKLAGTKGKDDTDLKEKWRKLCIFLGGIECLVNNLYLCNNSNEEIWVKIISKSSEEDINEIYPLNRKYINELVDTGVLVSGSNTDTKSKISMEYSLKNSLGEELESSEYIWQFDDNETWVNTFTMFSDSKFLSLIYEDRVIPNAYSNTVDEMIDSLTEGELYYLVNNKNMEYTNLYKKFELGSLESIITKNIAELFSKSMQNINENGLFTSFCNTQIIQGLLQEYSILCDKIKRKIQNKEVSIEIVSLISKAFMMVNNQELSEKYIIGAIIPPYHPIMLERIIERYRYLCNGFGEIFMQLQQIEEEIPISKIYKRFDRFSQLSTVTTSVEFLIGKNNNYIGQKNTLGYYTIFGESNKNYCGSDLQVLNFSDEDDDISNREITPISENIGKIIKDYIKTYPSKLDGIRIAFYQPREVKEIISGLDIAIKELNNLKRINLIVYTSDYRGKGSNYFKYWINNNFNEDDEIVIEPTIKYFDINISSDIKKYVTKHFIECDLTFIDGIMTDKNISEEDTKFIFQDDRIVNSKYPTVYLPMICSTEKNRKILLSQPQFKCANDFSQLMVYVNSKIAKDDDYRIIKTVIFNDDTQELLEVINEKSSWVIIQDENIDKKIIEMTGNKIISFSTGKGYFGELNLSISTKNEYLEDLERFLAKRLQRKFSNWKDIDIKKATKMCVDYAKDMDGAEIIKAINPSDEAVNEYLAYLLTTKLLKVDISNIDEFYVRKLVSVDSHSHLFDEQINLDKTKRENRPDFMLIEISKENNDLESQDDLNIKITLIECKVAQKNAEHSNKAKCQLIAGYKRLEEIWGNIRESVQDRYWFNQLYRLVAYNNNFNLDINKLNLINNKLYQINEKMFNLTIDNKAITYWLDTEFEDIVKRKDIIEYGIDIEQIEVDRYGIKQLLTEGIIYVSLENKNKEKLMIAEKNDKEQQEDICIKDNNKDAYKSNIQYKGNNETNLIVESDIHIVNNEMIEKEIKMINSSNKIELLTLFKNYENVDDIHEKSRIDEQLDRLKQEFQLRNIKIHIVGYVIGPDIIRVSIKLGVGVDVSKISKYTSDIKMWLAINEEPSIFIEDGFVKLDIARKNRKIVSFRECISKTLENPNILKDREDKLYVLLGADIVGNSRLIDLSDSNNPHLLVAGQTGSGKSVLLASMLTSMMVYYTPDELEFWLVDPKMVELTVFEESIFTKHSVTEAEEVEEMLKEVVNEMNRRYKLFKANKVQNIASYNRNVESDEKLKRIVVVIDEYGVLMESGNEFKKEFETSLKKLSQLARAAGIHLIICTQSPKADIITTTIRNNLPARIGLKVADSNASGLILDGSGCEKLLGKGDMLLKTADTSIPVRCKSPFIEQDEIRALNEYYEK